MYGYIIPSFKNLQKWYTCKGHKDGTNTTVMVSKVLKSHDEAKKYKDAQFVAVVYEEA